MAGGGISAARRGSRQVMMQRRAGLHIGVVRSAGALGRHPNDILRRVLDVAGLAVNAVLGVDLEARGAVLVFNHFVDTGRAVTLCRLVV